MRTLLTGATGYLGLHILKELLADGREVTAVARSPDRLGPLLRHPKLRIWQADLRDASRVAEVVPGHAACVHAALLWGAPGTELDLPDTAAAVKLFDAAGRQGVSRVVLISSAAVHRPFSGFMAEDDRITTADLYGATKAAAELFLWATCAAHAMQGVVLRPGPIVGPPAFPGGSFRSDERIARLVEGAARGEPLPVLRGEGRQFSDVRAVARAAVALSDPAAPQGVYLCMARELTTWEWIARRAAQILGSRSEVVVAEREDAAPAPLFRVERLERILGAAPRSAEAMQEHLAHLARALLA